MKNENMESRTICRGMGFSLSHCFIISFLVVLIAACSGHPSLPTSFEKADKAPRIYPDYTDVTVPPNIAPLNFLVDSVDDVVAEVTADNYRQTFGGKANKVQFKQKDWQELLQKAKGTRIDITLYTKKDGRWLAYSPFSIHVAKEDIDPYVSFRQLPPTFVGYDELSIRQRNLTNFDETDIYNNRMISKGIEGQCINCHSYQNYRTDNMMFHTRMEHPGTMIVCDGKLSFVDTKVEGMISAAAYNSWHPSLPIIAFSTDHTMQSFHTRDVTKVEVMESASDLIIYDIKQNRVLPVLSDSAELELFPSWSPDGKWLYYCSAHYEYKGEYENTDELLNAYRSLQYNLYRIPFDAQGMTFGQPELIYDAQQKNRSAVQPRVSQDGRYVLFAEGPWGLFHIWHPTAEVCILDLQTGRLLNTSPMNSHRAESYPSFSSNDRWILFESRRDDGNYTRLYLAYFDASARLHKAFEVPAEDPEQLRLLLRSQSRPELMKEPVRISPREFRDKMLSQPTKVKS